MEAFFIGITGPATIGTTGTAAGTPRRCQDRYAAGKRRGVPECVGSDLKP